MPYDDMTAIMKSDGIILLIEDFFILPNYFVFGRFSPSYSRFILLSVLYLTGSGPVEGQRIKLVLPKTPAHPHDMKKSAFIQSNNAKYLQVRSHS